jgi:hypothetical protein
MKKAERKDYLTITVEREDGGDPVSGRVQICDYGTPPAQNASPNGSSISGRSRGRIIANNYPSILNPP